MENNLTDRAFWKNFWESKQGLIFPVRSNYVFSELLQEVITKRNIKSAIELGGFPGYYTVYLKKYQHLDTTLFDYYIHRDIIKKLLAANVMEESDIHIIEADLFNYTPTKQYDLVTSFGLIEHFQDTKAILETHLQFLKPGGTLFVTLPNFKSINGWVQRTFDIENYHKHNINSMDLQLLKNCCKELGLNNIECHYSGRFTIWLENYQNRGMLTKLFFRSLWVSGKVFSKIFPFESKSLSPYIVLQATK